MRVVIDLRSIFIWYITVRTFKGQKRFLEYMLTHCCVGEYNLLKFFFLDISKREKKKCNTILLLITLYISSVWYGRANKIQIVNIFISAILNYLRLLKSLLGNSLYKCLLQNFVT